jgi:tryptophanyl-tRNA synthetase
LARYFAVVDYHSITTKFVGKNLSESENDPTDEISIRNSALNQEERPEELTLKTAATLLACGIDPKQSTLFV